MTMPSERIIQNRIHLRLGQETGLLVIRIQGGGAKVDGRWVNFTAIKGFPDLLCFLAEPRRTFGIEVKTPRGRLSEDQRRCHALLESHGVPCFVAKSVEDAVQALDAVRKGER